MSKFMLAVAMLFILLVIPLTSAYIDPGTGGYLASSLFSTIATYLAIAFAAIAAFFSKKFIIPIKKFYKKHKKLSILILLIILAAIASTIYLNIAKDPKFDISLSGAHIYSSEKIYPGYNLYE